MDVQQFANQAFARALGARPDPQRPDSLVIPPGVWLEWIGGTLFDPMNEARVSVDGGALVVTEPLYPHIQDIATRFKRDGQRAHEATASAELDALLRQSRRERTYPPDLPATAENRAAIDAGRLLAAAMDEAGLHDITPILQFLGIANTPENRLDAAQFNYAVAITRRNAAPRVS